MRKNIKIILKIVRRGGKQRASAFYALLIRESMWGKGRFPRVRPTFYAFARPVRMGVNVWSKTRLQILFVMHTDLIVEKEIESRPYTTFPPPFPQFFLLIASGTGPNRKLQHLT